MPEYDIYIGASPIDIYVSAAQATLQSETTSTILAKLEGVASIESKIGVEYLPAIQTRTSSEGPPVSGSLATGASAVMTFGVLAAYDIFTIGSDTFQFLDLPGDVVPGYYPVILDNEDPGVTHINVINAINLVSVEVNATYRSEDGEIDLHANNLGTSGNTIGLISHLTDMAFLWQGMGTEHMDGGIDNAVTGTPADVLGQLCRVGPYSITGERTEEYDWYISESIAPAVWRQLDEATAGGAPTEHALNHAADGSDPICYQSDTAPVTALVGQQWMDTTTGRKYEWFDGVWVELVGVIALGVSSVNERSGEVVLTAEDVGLENVDNTSDATKQAAAEARGSRNVAIVLGADEAGNENTVTLKSSPTLTIPLEVGTWAFEALILVNGGASYAAAGTRQKLHFDGTGTFTGAFYAADNSAASSLTWPNTRQTDVPNVERLASANSSATLRIGTLVVTAPGNLVVQYAQRTATAAASPSLAVPSYIRAIKL